MDFLQDFALRNNTIIGACHAAPLDPSRLMASPFVPFVTPHIEKRINPATSLKNVQSIIVIGVPPTPSQPHHSVPDTESPKAYLSSLGANADYHFHVKTLLRNLVDPLKSIYGDFKYKLLVDSSGLDERTLAYRAGLGFFGRNGLIISQKFGSRFNIGCMLTSISLDDISTNIPKVQHCPPQCRQCIEACPTNALEKDYLRAERCISYLTQKEELTPQESVLLHNQLYGCDICQNVCPFNTPEKTVAIHPEDWLVMDEATLTKQYAHTAMMWRGATILHRNAKIAKKSLT